MSATKDYWISVLVDEEMPNCMELMRLWDEADVGISPLRMRAMFRAR